MFCSGVFCNWRESNGCAAICSPKRSRYSLAEELPSVLVYLQVAAPVIILLGPRRNVAKRVIVLQDKQAGTPWHPSMHKAGWAARRDCKPAGLSFRCERSGTAQGAVPQGFQGLMLSQGKWSTAFLLDKWIAASLCKLIIWPLFAIWRNLWCWSSESAIK